MNTKDVLAKHGSAQNLINQANNKLGALTQVPLERLVEQAPHAADTINEHYQTIGRRINDARNALYELGDSIDDFKKYPQRNIDADASNDAYVNETIDRKLYDLTARTKTAVDNTYKLLASAKGIRAKSNGAIAKQLRKTDPETYHAIDELLYQDPVQQQLRTVRNDFQHGYLEYTLTPALSSSLEPGRQGELEIQDYYIEHAHSDEAHEVQDFAETLYLSAIDQITNTLRIAAGKPPTEDILPHKNPGTSFSGTYRLRDHTHKEYS